MRAVGVVARQGNAQAESSKDGNEEMVLVARKTHFVEMVGCRDAVHEDCRIRQWLVICTAQPPTMSDLDYKSSRINGMLGLLSPTMLTFLRIPDAGTSTARPKLARENTDLLASYYQSPLADQGINYSPRRPKHRRSTSGDSTSSSDYSSQSASTSDHSIQEELKPATRRASVPSEGGADRRRLAIVQMDPVGEADSPSSSSAVRSRRGLETRLEGLALVAPPDTAQNFHEYLPTSAPPTAHPRTMLRHFEDKGHNRSASEANPSSPRSKPSRDVGIVGTASSSSAPLESPKKLPRLQTASESLLPPVFQEPHSSRASTPNTTATPADSRSLSPFAAKRRSTDLSVHTPEIGQAKEIHVPVASPVVVDLGPDASLRVGNSSFDRRSPALKVVEPRPASPLPLSSYLHYQPGLHATAGPLPPPPRATFSIDQSTPPPPRPPRLHSPPPRRRRDLDGVNQPLQLAVSAVLSSSGSSTPSSRSISPARPVDTSSEDSHDETLHRREGAFSPSVISTTPSTSPSDYSPTTAHPGRTIDGLIPSVNDGSKGPASVGGSNPVSSPMVIPAPPRLESLPEHHGEEWTHISRDLTASPSSDGHVSQDRVSWESYSPPSQEGVTPSPPPKSFKTNLTTGLRRFSSLPRTPSPSNRSLGRSSSTSTRSRGRTPSPSIAPVSLPSVPIQMLRRRKIVSRNPPALSSADIVSRKSALERCALYAQKINELYVLDCGLENWMAETRKGSTGPGKRSTLTSSTQRGEPQPRNVSHSSMKSEVTFARRPDATVATDLSTKPSDIAPTVPALPYPALSPRSRPVPLPSPSMRMLATSPTPSKTSNFFSSLGRKASMNKRDRPNPMSFSLNPPTTGTRLTKNPPVSMNPRAVVAISNSPSVPGGPRAPPNRALRTQSITVSPFSSNSSMSDHSASAVRRPSLFAPASSSSRGSGSASSESQSRSTTGSVPGVSDREFERQVDKLADLLPQAERSILAGYLRRAGQDILAIGQYLEDEKNGRLRRD
ncbi:hypothetical protein B0H19DRAFT_341987 [Mycena capillaripes]|nr:hypothetical protein B0H19DRAFT_341987 [Mycena capillaripes]